MRSVHATDDSESQPLTRAILTYSQSIDPLDPFSLRFMQIALVEVLILALPGGLLGAHIVLRRLAFFTHGVGAAAFPGLVVAGPLGVPPQAAALGVGLAFAGGLERLSRSARLGYDAATALLLVTALAAGIVLASDVFESGAQVDRLLFGTLIGLGVTDLAVSGTVTVAVVLATMAFGRTWIATGFDPESARSLELKVVAADWVLVVLLATAVIAAVDAVGALLVSALLVVPAATVRVGARSVSQLYFGAVALAAIEGIVGLWIAYQADVPPGAAIAALGGAVFALVVVWSRLNGRPG